MDLRRRVIVDVTDPRLPEAARPAFAHHMHQHPLVDYYRRTRDPNAHKVSDFLTRRQFHWLALYTEYLHPFLGGVDDQLACTFVASATRVNPRLPHLLRMAPWVSNASAAPAIHVMAPPSKRLWRPPAGPGLSSVVG
jgi:hypothetical protein